MSEYQDNRESKQENSQSSQSSPECEVCVLGSLNVDFTAYCIDPDLPSPGQTVMGSLFEKSYGGKGANQAVMAAKLGATVKMLGKVGSDDLGDDYLRHLKKEHVDTAAIEQVRTTCTGVAQITVSGSGENCIVVVPGANGMTDIDYAQSVLESSIYGSKVLLCQAETPIEGSIAALKFASSHGTSTVFNPAPATALDPCTCYTLVCGNSDL